jgi:uncharacterized membrane protein YeaQ/YmgE (transglycosylase-associated protein family)
MPLVSFLLMLIIASIAGAIGAGLAGRHRTGCLASIALGFIGAIIGSTIAQKLDLPLFFWLRFGSYKFPVIWAVFGSAIFVAFLNIFSGPRAKS